MIKEDIKIMDNCRKAIEKYFKREWKGKGEAERTKATEEMIAVLEENGFPDSGNGEAVTAFSKWNDDKCFAEYLEILVIEGQCSKEACPNKKCLAMFGSEACYHEEAKPADEKVKRYFFKVMKTSKSDTFDDIIPTKAACPDGYGYSSFSRSRKPDVDIKWTVQSALKAAETAVLTSTKKVKE